MNVKLYSFVFFHHNFAIGKQNVVAQMFNECCHRIYYLLINHNIVKYIDENDQI